MRHAREIIRLKFSSVSTHEIARRLGMARSTVRETLKRAEAAGLRAGAGGHPSQSMSLRSARRAFRDAWKPTAMSKAAPTNFSTCAKSSSVRRRAASFAR